MVVVAGEPAWAPLGMKFHDHLLRLRTEAFYRWLGAVLMLVVLVGIYRVLTR